MIKQLKKELILRILRASTILALSCTLLVFFLVMVCDSFYFYRSDSNPLNGLCFPLYESLFPANKHKGFPMWPSTVMLTMILLLVPCLIFFFPLSVAARNDVRLFVGSDAQHIKSRKVEKTRYISYIKKIQVTLWKGDPKIWFWALILLVLPIVVILLIVSTKDISNVTGMKLWIGRLANPAGYCATITLSLFMVPVAKQSPLLAAIGWSPIQALGFHVWAGRICFLMVFLHGALYVIKYGNKGKNSFWSNVATGMLPSSKCWSFQSLWAFQSGSHCYKIWRNATGVVSGIALFLLVMTSLNCIRRWNYRFFYVSHILFGWMMLLFAIFHFYWIAIYLVPGLIYYLACSLPISVEQAANFFIDGGTMLKESRILASSNGCMELTFEKSPLRRGKVQAPAYVRICVPEISMMWHPFTVPHTDDDHVEELKLLIRRYGFFTSALYKRLQQTSKPPPTILVDGFYQGSDWLSHALKHDAVLMVSGGIGVTPMLPLLQLLYQHSKSTMTQPTQLVSFHWFCRDEGLIRHVLNKYIKPILEKLEPPSDTETENFTPSCHFQVIIHFTARESDDLEPFLMSKLDDDDEAHLGNKESSEVENGTTLSNESFQDEPELRLSPVVSSLSKKDSSDDPVKDISNSYQEQENKKGTAVKAASFSHLGDSRLIVFMGLVAFIAAYGIYLYWYIVEVREHRERIFFRGYSMYAIITFLLGTALVMECYRRKIRGCNFARDPVGCDEEEQCDIGAKSLLHCQQLPLSGRSGLDISIHLDVINGRPILNDVVHPIVEAELPGAFYCGPRELLKTVQKEIKAERRRIKGVLAARCCNYQEHFEM